jgi:hydrogenase nickel incorporation protein HypB
VEIDLSKPILDMNERMAAENRVELDRHGVFVLDLMASPGAGKTSTILATIAALRDRYRIAVIEGDIASKVDAEKVKAHGIPAVQINTGGACHLESDMIKRALAALPLAELDLVIIENVGNLVCPTDFYLGENAKVMILSVPEGHDKPYKYPGIFQISEAVILNKVDTMSVFDFNEEEFTAEVHALNPRAPIFRIAATKGEGVAEWAEWLAARIDALKVSLAQKQAGEGA